MTSHPHDTGAIHMSRHQRGIVWLCVVMGHALGRQDGAGRSPHTGAKSHPSAHDSMGSNGRCQSGALKLLLLRRSSSSFSLPLPPSSLGSCPAGEFKQDHARLLLFINGHPARAHGLLIRIRFEPNSNHNLNHSLIIIIPAGLIAIFKPHRIQLRISSKIPSHGYEPHCLFGKSMICLPVIIGTRSLEIICHCLL